MKKIKLTVKELKKKKGNKSWADIAEKLGVRERSIYKMLKKNKSG